MSRQAIAIGDRASITVEVTSSLIDGFAAFSGDTNPLHMDVDAARICGFRDRVAHGCVALSYLSTLIGTQLPGTGALWRRLEVDWVAPVFPGESLTIHAEVVQYSRSTNSLVLRVTGSTQTGKEVLAGKAVVGLAEQVGIQSSAPADPDRLETAETRSSPGGGAVLVTGASRGIGRAVASALAAAGRAVGVGYCDSEDEATAVVRSITGSGGIAVSVQLDVTRVGSSEEAVDRLRRRLGAVSGFVHAATPRLDQSTVEALDLRVVLNYLNAYVIAGLELTKAVLDGIRQEGRGRLVFIGTSALIGSPPPRMAAYVAAKSALLGLVRSLAVELGPLGATCNLVSPGLTFTDLTRDTSARVRLAEAQRNPVRRLATAEDTAAVVEFLFRDGASFVNGAHIPVTGGAGVI